MALPLLVSLALLVAGYGILFVWSLVLSRRQSPGPETLRLGVSLAYYPVMAISAWFYMNAATTLLEVVLSLVGTYIVANLFRLPAAFVMARRFGTGATFCRYARASLTFQGVVSGPFLAAIILYYAFWSLVPNAPFLVGMTAAVAVLLLVSSTTPWLLARTCRRDPRLSAIGAAVAARAHVPAPVVMVLPTRAASIANAFVMGPFNHFLFVTDHLWEETGPDLTAATVAHEIGHRTGGHLTIALLFLPILDLAISLSGASPPFSVALLFGGFLILFALMRRSEYKADEFAAHVLGADLMIRDLEALAKLNRPGVREPPPRRPSPFATHPTVRGRIERLRRLLAAGVLHA